MLRLLDNPPSAAEFRRLVAITDEKTVTTVGNIMFQLLEQKERQGLGSPLSIKGKKEFIECHRQLEKDLKGIQECNIGAGGIAKS